MKAAGRATLAAAFMLVSSAVLRAADDKSHFEPRPAGAYSARQTNANVTIAAEPYENQDELKKAFGKVDFSRLGILPVLVVIDNGTDHALQLDRMRVQLITADRQTIDSISAEDAVRPGRVKTPVIGGGTSPFPGIRRGQRGPKNEAELSSREFAAPAAAPHSQVFGFFYYRLGKGPDRIPGSKIYITGIRDARTGQDLLYFEIALDGYARAR
jgi:hypothetical protein